MAKITTYQVRAGNALPRLGTGTTSAGNIIFTFGTETQEVESEECSKLGIVTSKDMCLLGGDYFSANYKALPGKVDGELIFNTNIAKKPILSDKYGSNNGGGGGSPVG